MNAVKEIWELVRNIRIGNKGGGGGRRRRRKMAIHDMVAENTWEMEGRYQDRNI